MVLLTMTESMVVAFEKIQNLQNTTKNQDRHANSREIGKTSDPTQPEEEKISEENDAINDARGAGLSSDNAQNPPTDSSKVPSNHNSTEPSLENPKVGNPVSHGQVVDLWKELKASEISPCSLDLLLRGARVYIPPLPPKPEPTSEYKALMARLRREEELRAYERMINPPPPMETFAQKFPSSSAAHAFSSNFNTADLEDDGVTYADIDRQMALIFNVLISIVACAGAIWVVARWWSTPARLALSMGGSMLVGIAEVVVYSGYIRRVGEAKGKAKNLKEVKEVIQTWVVGGEEDEGDSSLPLVGKDDAEFERVRRRKPPAS